MGIISETFRLTLWFVLCVAMAIGMIIFAFVFMVFSLLSKTFGFRENIVPEIRLAR